MLPQQSLSEMSFVILFASPLKICIDAEFYASDYYLHV